MADFFFYKIGKPTSLDREYETLGRVPVYSNYVKPEWKKLVTGKEWATFNKTGIDSKKLSELDGGVIVTVTRKASHKVGDADIYLDDKKGGAKKADKEKKTVNFYYITKARTKDGKNIKVKGWIPSKLPDWKAPRLKPYRDSTPMDEHPVVEAEKDKTEEEKKILKDAAIVDVDRVMRAREVKTFIESDVIGALGKKYADKYTIATISETEAELNKEAFSDINIQAYNHAIRARTIHYADRNLWDYRYNRMQFANPYDTIGPTREYLFFTKPDLHIMGTSDKDVFDQRDELNPQLGGDPFWREMLTHYERLIIDLQYSAKRKDAKDLELLHDKSEFIRVLTNAVSGSLDLPDISSDTTETPANIFGTTLQYKTHSFKSDEGFDFNIEFHDNPILDVYHLFKMWNEYSNAKNIGQVTPPGRINCNAYRVNKILHDQIGIFKFIVGEDMETILYYAYLTGCFPKSVPRGSFNNINGSQLSYSIDWHAQFVEDMNPLILVHFNMLMRKQLGLASFGGGTYSQPLTKANIEGKGYEYVPIYNNRYHEINGEWVDAPIVSRIVDNSIRTKSRYLLQWYKSTK